MSAVHVIVSGRVHAVGFRMWTEEEARQLEVNGWVRNRSDGTVEAVFTGSEVAVDQMLTRVRVGPLGARVEHVETSDWNGGKFDSFTILSTKSV